jgi:hypothetical protein
MASPQFPGGMNVSLSFFIYGQDNAGAVHGGDQYVYAFYNGEPVQWSATKKLSRCLISNLDQTTTNVNWEYFQGGTTWSSDWQNAQNMIDMTGKAPFGGQPKWFPNYKSGRYIYIATINPFLFETTGIRNWELWESEFPWGPWVSLGVTQLSRAAATVESGAIEYFGRGAEYANVIANSVQDSSAFATAVVVFNGHRWEDNPPYDPTGTDYLLHVLSLVLNEGSAIGQPPPPGL